MKFQSKGNGDDVCKLCRNRGSLRNSHFLPAAMYKFLHSPGESFHMIVSKEKTFSTSSQFKAYLLCDDCEQRFNGRGERWVLANGYRGRGRFRLQTTLQ